MSIATAGAASRPGVQPLGPAVVVLSPSRACRGLALGVESDPESRDGRVLRPARERMLGWRSPS